MRTKARGTAALKPSPVRSAESHGHDPVSLSCLFFLSHSLSPVSYSHFPLLLPICPHCLSFTVCLSLCLAVSLSLCHCLPRPVSLSCVCSVFHLSWCLVTCVSLSLSLPPLALSCRQSIFFASSDSLFEWVSFVSHSCLSVCPFPVDFSLSVRLFVFFSSVMFYMSFSLLPALPCVLC